MVPSWPRDLKGAWYAGPSPREPRLTLTYPHYKDSCHGQRADKEGSAEKICVSLAPGHKGVYLGNSFLCSGH